MEIKDIIKQRRLALSLTMADVAKAVGVSEATVSRWESGNISNMKQNRIAALAKVLNISPSVIMGWEDYSENVIPENVIPLPKMNKLPLLGNIACGEPILANDNIEDIIDIPEHIKADFALKCKGNSMIEVNINDGDIVYIRKQATVNNGEIAAVLIDNEATLKKVFLSGDTLSLIACNSEFAPLVYSGSELETIRILGKAVAYTSVI